MLLINGITNDSSQAITLTGVPGVNIKFTLRYMPRAQLWVAGVDDGTISIQNINVVTSLNFLRQWKNIISYGIACVRTDGLDPYQLTDFLNGTAKLYLLNASEVAAIENGWFA